MLMGLAITILATSIATAVSAQTIEKTNPADKNFPTTLQSVNPVKYYGPRKEKKKKKGTTTYNAKNEYYDRVETAWKEQEKREKRFDRGEATDYMKPPYFGHKKAPKIRPIGKRKYCKICGIRH
jgi:hypothetical protein